MTLSEAALHSRCCRCRLFIVFLFARRCRSAERNFSTLIIQRRFTAGVSPPPRFRRADAFITATLARFQLRVRATGLPVILLTLSFRDYDVSQVISVGQEMMPSQ